MIDRLKLFPNHRHQWIDVDPDWNYPTPDDEQIKPYEVRCIVCGFTVPRNAAKLDGQPATPHPPQQESR